MKTIGILGGMSYESTVHYYERINRQVNAKMGNLVCAKLILYNVNFEEIRQWMLKEDWDSIAAYLITCAHKLEEAGADYLVIATNTIHKVAKQMEDAISIPLIHIADCVAEKCKQQNIMRVGLIGTGITMQEDFLKERLEANGLKVTVPNSKEEIETIDSIIFDELCKGIVLEESKKKYQQVIEHMIQENQIEGLILGCTEIEMLIKPEDVRIPIFDTTQAHIDSIVAYCLEEKK